MRISTILLSIAFIGIYLIGSFSCLSLVSSSEENIKRESRAVTGIKGGVPEGIVSKQFGVVGRRFRNVGNVGVLPSVRTRPVDAASVGVRPVSPVKPLNPVSPFRPVVPVKPVGPVVPVAPVRPKVPVAPVQPKVPVAPVRPKVPVAPVRPIVPVAPVAPVQPIAPTAPVQPVLPVVPAQPIAPIAPVQPVLPVVPAQPIAPIAPVQPVVPDRPLQTITTSNKPIATPVQKETTVSSKPVEKSASASSPKSIRPSQKAAASSVAAGKKLQTASQIIGKANNVERFSKLTQLVDGELSRVNVNNRAPSGFMPIKRN